MDSENTQVPHPETGNRATFKYRRSKIKSGSNRPHASAYMEDVLASSTVELLYEGFPYIASLDCFLSSKTINKI